MATGFQSRLPGGFVLFREDVVIQLPKKGQYRHLELTQRRSRIVEVRLPNRLPVRMVRRSWHSVRSSPDPARELFTGGCVFVPALPGASELVLQFHNRNDSSDGLRLDIPRAVISFCA
jgi:hypothetical protein